MSLRNNCARFQAAGGINTRCWSAADLAAMLAQRRADWLPRYFPNGRLRGSTFYLGSTDGTPVPDGFVIRWDSRR